MTIANWFRQEKGSGLIWVYLATAVLGVSSAGLSSLGLWQSKLISVEVVREQAFYYAEAGIDQKLREIRIGNAGNIPSTAIGAGTFSVTYDSTAKLITSTGVSGGVSRTITAKVNKTPPSGLRGVITGNGNMTTSGSVTVDGRDHDLGGSMVGPGSYGVSTSGTFTQSGSSEIGGNGAAPDDPAPAGAVQTNGPVTPTTPEEVLGLPAGSLDVYKTTTVPTLPMNNQVVYLTSAGGSSTWNAPNFGDANNPSTGVLIFHNTTGTAEIKNIHGHFRGIIITDKLTHINGSAVVRGAVVVIAANGTIGNGNALVQYSTLAIANAPIGGQYTIVSWEDSLN